MNLKFLGMEFWRLVMLILIFILGGMLSHHWLLSLSLTLFGYITWIYYKLYQLQKWLVTGAKNKRVPNSSGIWESIAIQILILRKESMARKKRMGMLLQRSQRIVSGLPYATVVLNKHEEIVWANKISAGYLNIDIKKDLGQRIDNLIRLPEFHTALGQKLTQEINYSPAKNPHQKLALQLIFVQKDLTLLIAQDVTERENILQMRKNFIANASHELRTPLTVITGYLEIMQEDERFPEHLQMAVASATDQSVRMKQIIEDLLTLSRLENSFLDDSACTEIDLPVMLQSICQDEKQLIKKNTHRLETTIDPNLKILGAESEIQSVCVNLIHNAIRHTQNGTKIQVSWQKISTDKACLSVQDNGQGIPTEHLPHLTERFYRVDKGRSRDKGGTGLGLAIVQHIIQRHGGKLDIESHVGKGSVFSVCFPIERGIDKK